MFDPTQIKTLIDRNRKGLEKLKKLEELLNGRFENMGPQIRALILAAASGEPLLFVGPPGTAKSRLIRDFCEFVGLIDPECPPEQQNKGYFEYLVTQFTEPGELFGYYDLAALSKSVPEMRRLDDGMMQKAQIVFLDEVFNGSSAILNAILAFMNERLFHDRGRRHPVAWHCLFGATNNVPRNPELAAVFDRFVLRSHFDYVEAKPEPFRDLISKGWQETYRKHEARGDLTDLLGEMVRLQDSIRLATDKGQLVPNPDQTAYGNLAYLVTLVRDRDLGRFSNRRLIRFVYVMLIHRLYRAVCEVDTGDLRFGFEEYQLFWTYFIDDPGQLGTSDLSDLKNLIRHPA
jgi:MoxR-like ATPase